MSKLRWCKFYWSDWEGDPALKACSMAARGMWMALLCIAAQGTPYGHVTFAGKPPSVASLAHHVGARPKDVARWIAELVRHGVARRTESGVLYSLRMVRDASRIRHASDAAKARWNGGDTAATRESHESDSDVTRTRESAETRRKGRANVAGASTEYRRENLYPYKRDTDSPVPDARSDAERVVRFDGARAPHRTRLPDAEAAPSRAEVIQRALADYIP